MGVVLRARAPDGSAVAIKVLGARAVVADLGLAKHFSQDAPGAHESVALSRSREMRGTAGYAPPEQWADAKSVGPSADVFALGAIVYECLAGRPAFQGETPIEV